VTAVDGEVDAADAADLIVEAEVAVGVHLAEAVEVLAQVV